MTRATTAPPAAPAPLAPAVCPGGWLPGAAVRAAGTTTTASLSAAAVALVVNVLMARTLGPTARGEVAAVLQTAYLAAPLLTLGVERHALTAARGTHAGADTHVWLVALPLAGLGLVLHGPAAAAVVLVAACTGAMTIRRSTGTAAGRLRLFLVVHLVTQCWVLLASVALHVASVSSVTAWTAVYVAPAGALFLVCVVAASGRARQGVAAPRWVTRASLAHLPGTLAALAAARLERLALAVLAPGHALGTYIAVATASEVVAWVAQGLSEQRATRWGRAAPGERPFGRVLLVDAAYFLLVAAALGVAIWLVLLPALGPGFEPGRALVVPLCLAAASWAVYRQVVARLVATAGARSASLAELGTAACVAGGCLLAVPTEGAGGAAWAVVVSYVSGTAGGLLLLRAGRAAGAAQGAAAAGAPAEGAAAASCAADERSAPCG